MIEGAMLITSPPLLPLESLSELVLKLLACVPAFPSAYRRHYA
jgi:hypothetical protein